jgi:hypothetical protein
MRRLGCIMSRKLEAAAWPAAARAVHTGMAYDPGRLARPVKQFDG